MHEEYTIGVSFGGQGGFDCRGGFHVSDPGSVILINPGEVHNARPTVPEGWTYVNFYLEPSFMKTMQESLEVTVRGLPHFSHPLVSNPSASSGLKHLVALINGAASRLELDSTMLSTLAQVLAQHSGHPPRTLLPGCTHTGLLRARDYLIEHYSYNVSMLELADVAGLTPYYLMRLFRRKFGLPPHAYRNQVRVNRAKAALRAGHPIVDAALDSGFFDQSHLNRIFKRTVGMTPVQYRDARRCSS
jgi:AraC-like DNA-binding protein